MDPAGRIVEILRRHPAVRSASVAGSRARGDTTALSDLDVEVDVADWDAFMTDLPGLVAELQPLGQQWDRLSEHWNYMLMLRGPLKVDLIFDRPYEMQPPWVVYAETLPAIDHHFWDWTLWLSSKRLRGQDELVGNELAKMHHHLLGPLGVGEVPADLWVAIDRYKAARARAERELGIEIDRTMEDEVTQAIHRALGSRPSS